MKREYVVIIEAKKAHQPHSDQIMDAVKDLVDKRVSAFPTANGGTKITIVPRRNK